MLHIGAIPRHEGAGVVGARSGAGRGFAQGASSVGVYFHGSIRRRDLDESVLGRLDSVRHGISGRFSAAASVDGLLHDEALGEAGRLHHAARGRRRDVVVLVVEVHRRPAFVRVLTVLGQVLRGGVNDPIRCRLLRVIRLQVRNVRTDGGVSYGRTGSRQSGRCNRDVISVTRYRMPKSV